MDVEVVHDEQVIILDITVEVEPEVLVQLVLDEVEVDEDDTLVLLHLVLLEDMLDVQHLLV